MLSRRSFLLGTLLGLAGSLETVNPRNAWSKQGKVAINAGPRPLSRQDWPPAILPDYIGLIEKGYCCFSDETGRMSIVDLRKPDSVKNQPRIIAELTSIGKKVVDFATSRERGYAIVITPNEQGDPQYMLVVLSFVPLQTPNVVSRLPLEKFSEATCVATSQDIICIGGLSKNQEHLVCIYRASSRQGRNPDATFLSSFTTELPIVRMDLQDKSLVVLENGRNVQGATVSQVDCVSLVNPASPELKKSLKTEGEYRCLARFRDSLLIAGSAHSGATACEAKSISLGPIPHIVSTITLEPLNNVLDASAQKGRFVVLGDGIPGRAVISLTYDKALNLTREQALDLSKQKGAYGPRGRIAIKDRTAYIASGWAGVQVLTSTRDGWAPSYIYTIPRMPVGSLATWGNMLVLAASSLQLYDISRPTKPSLVDSAELESSIKSMAGAGSYVICLGKDAVTLRQMEKLQEPVTSIKMIGQQLCFDQVRQSAYVLQDENNRTVIHQLKVYSDNLVKENSFELSNKFARVTSHGGYLLAGGLNEIALYGVTDKLELVGSRHFENLAVRDLAIDENNIFVTAVDRASKGFLLILSKNQKDLNVIGSIDLPNDGVALAVSGNKATIVGRSKDGKDTISIVDFSTPSAPKIITSMPAIEAASAVAIKDHLAIVAGRGLEIFNLM